MAVAPAVDIWEAVAARIDPAAARPCLARHVELKEFSERGGGGFAMLANTRDLVYYRLEPDEVMVLPLLDGTRTVGEIVVAYLHESGELDFGAVAELVAELREGGFLTERYVDTDAVLQRALAPGGLRARVARFFKTLTVEWSGAERLTRWLYNHGLRALLMPAGELFATFVLVAGALAFTRTATDHREYTLAPQSVGLGLVVLLALNFVVVFVHELGHASLLVHYGRRVKGSGFRLSFGVPRFYIDSSDALMLDRGPRIAQSFAGTYFESVVTAIAALALWGAPDLWLAPTLYGFVVLNVFVVILNLVPLLELDGYWILSDVLRVSDLRPRAFAFIRHDAWAKLRTGRSFTRAELGLGLFGTLGLLFTILGIGFAGFFWFSTFGDLTAELWHAGALGIAALILLIAFVAGPVLRAVLATMRNLAGKVASLARHVRFRAQQGWRVEAVTMLDAQPAFDDLPADVRDDLVRWVGLRRCSAGTAVVRQGEHADAYYVVRRGLLDVIEEDATTGAERIIHRLGPGEAFGEVGVATGAPRRATVRAVTTAELFVVDKGTFDRLLADRIRLPEFAPTMQVLSELRALGPFAHLRSDALVRVRDEGMWCNVQAGEELVTQGDPGNAFYAVESGRLDVIADGQYVGTLGPGDHFGEIALLADVPRTATVRAFTPARVFRVGRAGFDRLVADAFRRGRLTSAAPVEFVRE